MEIGDKIRYYRKQQGLTQKDLAEGICTKSYLSKIESNIAKPHQDIVKILLAKLGVSEIDNESINVEEINRKLYEWYEVIKSRDKNKAKAIEMSIYRDISKIDDPRIIIEYQIFSLRYQLLLRNMDESKQLIHKLESVENHLSEKQKYYFYFFYGLYKYLQYEYIDSLEYYLKAEMVNQQIHMNEPELFYLLSLVYTKLHNVTLAIRYANISFDIFNRNMDLVRSIESQSVLSVNYIRLNEYEKAKQHLENSLKIAEKLNDTYLMSNLYHNIGYLYSKTNRHHEAIDYYFKSIELRKEKYKMLSNSIYYLTESFFALNNIDAAKEWLEKGLQIAEKHNIVNIQIKLNLLKLKYYDNKEEIVKFIEETGLSYLEEKQAWSELSEATQKLANYYANQQHYKTAYHYCCLANDYKTKIHK